ncbi:MAG: purine-binding chemotaxis protein CheW [Oligoflexia bacterium]|nr:purine-binding chemotaxis protein CheW [Oligoflexia bacterium]
MKNQNDNTDIKEALINLLNSSSTGGNQFVTFNIGNEEYGINIKSVQEITSYRELTHLPNFPTYVKGILNLRGNIIPVVDPRIKFCMSEIEHNKASVIIIVNTGEKNAGLIVDNIKDVLTIDANNIEEAPEMSTGLDTCFIEGIGKVGEKFVIILNVGMIFGKDDQLVNAIKANSSSSIPNSSETPPKANAA